MSIGLTPEYSFNYYSPDDVAYDPSTGNIFAIQNYRVSEQPALVNWNVTQFTPTGKIVSSFTSRELFGVSGISFLPNGNLILVSTRDQRIVEFTKTGEIAAGGIDFTSSEIFVAGQRALFSIAYRASTNTILGLDSRSRRIYEFDRQGNRISTLDLTPAFTQAGATGRFAGITIDPLTGNYLLTDDDTDATTGDNRIYEVTPTGEILSTIDIIAVSGFADPEGIAVDPTTRTAYVVFDNDDERGNELYLGNRNRIEAFKIELDTFQGDSRTNDTRIGDADTNNLLGGYGNDELLGMGGADIIYGGFDDDTLNGNQGNDQVFGGAGNDLARGGENEDYVSGGTGNDTVFGDAGNDTIVGGEGNDIINGNIGIDSISGGAGDDLMRGGRGDDILLGDAGNDTLMGDLNNDNLNGGDGNDSVMGEGGDDILNGGAGNDTLVGGASRDTFVLTSGQGEDFITDFVRDQDFIGLSGGLTYDQITFTQEQVNNQPRALIRIAATGEILASVSGVTTASLTRELFTIV